MGADPRVRLRRKCGRVVYSMDRNLEALRWRAADPQWHFRLALAAVLLFTFVHMLALPLIVSPDGIWYVRLANVLAGPAIISHWDFYRTPLFPLALNVAFRIGGEQPHMALLVSGIFGLTGVVLTGLVVRRVAGATSGAIALVVLAFYPVLVGYQHLLLTETGNFFWIALMLWSLVRVAKDFHGSAIGMGCWIALVIAAAYYWRPTLLNLSPIAAVALVLLRLLPPNDRRPYSQFMDRLRREGRRVAATALIIALGPWVLAFPWKQLTDRYKPNAYSRFFAEGIFRQILVPPDDPMLASVRTEYEADIARDLVNGRLPPGGVGGGGRYELRQKFYKIFEHLPFAALIRRYPARYISGAARAILFYLAVPHHGGDYENAAFSHYVFWLWPSTDSLEHSLGWEVKEPELAPLPFGGGALIGRWLDKINPAYIWLVFASSILSLLWFGVSLKQGDAVGLTLTGLPLAFLLMHALTLETIDRYGFPAYPMLLANAVIVFAKLLLRKKSVGPSVVDEIAATRAVSAESR